MNTTPDDWQPITTAPAEEGKLLLLWSPHKGIHIGERRPGWSCWSSIPGRYTTEPTHWMTLPPPPAK